MDLGPGSCEIGDRARRWEPVADLRSLLVPVDLNGGESDYSRRNRARRAQRRRRKKEFIPNRFLAFRFESTDELQRARSDGWVKGFQKGMRNSDGSQRRAKVQVNLDQIPDQSIIIDLRR